MAQVKLDSKSLWRLHRLFKPHLKQWGESYVLFDEVSGDTHMIGLLAGFILEGLMEASVSVSSSSALISVNNDWPLEETEVLVADVMVELSALQFVEEVL